MAGVRRANAEREQRRREDAARLVANAPLPNDKQQMQLRRILTGKLLVVVTRKQRKPPAPPK